MTDCGGSSEFLLKSTRFLSSQKRVSLL